MLPMRRILRLLLAISVSVWMAGAGCLLGCGNETQAFSLTPTDSTETVVAEDSCASSDSHDCCAKKARNQPPAANSGSHVPTGKPELRTLPSGMMESCPMALSASVIVSKVRTDDSHAVLALTVRRPFAHGTTGPIDIAINQPNRFNRGPTYLRCCVFLI
jgi:hypothetical protein